MHANEIWWIINNRVNGIFICSLFWRSLSNLAYCWCMWIGVFMHLFEWTCSLKGYDGYILFILWQEHSSFRNLWRKLRTCEQRTIMEKGTLWTIWCSCYVACTTSRWSSCCCSMILYFSSAASFHLTGTRRERESTWVYDVVSAFTSVSLWLTFINGRSNSRN